MSRSAQVVRFEAELAEECPLWVNLGHLSSKLARELLPDPDSEPKPYKFPRAPGLTQVWTEGINLTIDSRWDKYSVARKNSVDYYQVTLPATGREASVLHAMASCAGKLEPASFDLVMDSPLLVASVSSCGPHTEWVNFELTDRTGVRVVINFGELCGIWGGVWWRKLLGPEPHDMEVEWGAGVHGGLLNVASDGTHITFHTPLPKPSPRADRQHVDFKSALDGFRLVLPLEDCRAAIEHVAAEVERN